MSTVYREDCALLCSSQAYLNTWAKPISDLLLAGGWIQTSDTGQVNWDDLSNWTTPAAVSTVGGYQIWRMGDALQSCYIKFEFGSGANNAGRAGIWITIGTGSDGAGNITGALISRAFTGAYGNTTSAISAFKLIGSSDASRIVLIGTERTSYYSNLMFSIERTHDAYGNDTSEGIMLMLGCTTAPSSTVTALSVTNFQVLVFSGTSQANSTRIGACVASGTSQAGGDGDVAVSPVAFFNGMPTFPSKNLMVYLNADLPVRVSVHCDLYGGERWLPVGTDVVNTVLSNSNSTFLIWWD